MDFGKKVLNLNDDMEKALMDKVAFLQKKQEEEQAERLKQIKIFEEKQNSNIKFQRDFQERVLGQAHNIDDIYKRTKHFDDILKWKASYTEL